MKKINFGDLIFKLIAGGFILLIISGCHGVFRSYKDIIPFYHFRKKEKEISENRLYALTAIHILTFIFIIGILKNVVWE